MPKVLSLFAGACTLFVLLAWAHAARDRRTNLPVSKHVFENVAWGDTLVLSAKYAECGEFGGHREVIRICLCDGCKSQAASSAAEPDSGAVLSSEPRPLMATWSVDTTTCPTTSRKFRIAGQRVLSEVDEKIIANYLQQLMTRNWQKGLTAANAGHTFSASTAWGSLKLEFFDTEEQWQGFEELRDTLFKQTQRP